VNRRECSQRTSWLSTNRPSFAAANQVVTLTRATSSERVVKLAGLVAGRSVQCVCCERAFSEGRTGQRAMQWCRSLELVVPASNVVGRVVFVRGMVVKVRRVRTLLHLHRNARVGRHKHYDTHTHPFYDPLSGTTRVSRYQKGKTNLDYTEARDSEWQWHQLGHMQVCTSVQTDNHASTSPLGFYRPDALPVAQPTASKHWRHHYDIRLPVFTWAPELT